MCTHLHNWSLSLFSFQQLFWTQNVLFRSWFIRQRTEEPCFRYLAEPSTVSVYSCETFVAHSGLRRYYSKFIPEFFFPSRNSSHGHWNYVLEEVKLCAVCPVSWAPAWCPLSPLSSAHSFICGRQLFISSGPFPPHGPGNLCRDESRQCLISWVITRCSPVSLRIPLGGYWPGILESDVLLGKVVLVAVSLYSFCCLPFAKGRVML